MISKDDRQNAVKDIEYLESMVQVYRLALAGSEYGIKTCKLLSGSLESTMAWTGRQMARIWKRLETSAVSAEGYTNTPNTEVSDVEISSGERVHGADCGLAASYPSDHCCGCGVPGCTGTADEHDQVVDLVSEIARNDLED
jgi:hypothetical protein